MTREELVSNIEERLRYLKANLHVYLELCAELEWWDAKKINKQLEHKMAERLPNYRVSYYHDKPYWKKITIRMRGHVNSDKAWEYYVHYDSSKETVFDFAKFTERDTANSLRESIFKYQETLKDEPAMNAFLSCFENLNKDILQFHASMDLFDHLHSCVGKDYYKMLCETRFLTWKVDTLST